MKPPSKRFTPTWWSERLVPVLLAILLLVLVATLTVVILATFGVFARG